jgi:hypothetical protein
MGELKRRYRLSGFVLESRVALPELPSATGDPSYVFDVVRNGRTTSRPRWFHTWQEPGEPAWASFARTPAGYLVRFPKLADFEITGRAGNRLSRVRAWPRRTVPAETVRHLFLDQVWPLVLSASGWLVIHASAVVLPDGTAVAFAGRAGAGKSTLAAFMASAGCRILSDDCLLLKPSQRAWMAVPGYPGLRLWSDTLAMLGPRAGRRAKVAHYTSKKRVAGAALPFSRRAAPLSVMYLVHPSAPSATSSATPLDGATALMQLVPFTYLLDWEARDQLKRSFAHLASLTASVPILRLEVPREAARLAEVTGRMIGRRRIVRSNPDPDGY